MRTPQVSGRRRILLSAALVLVAIAVPLLTLPTLPRLSWLPVLLGLAPWIKEVLSRGVTGVISDEADILRTVLAAR